MAIPTPYRLAVSITVGYLPKASMSVIAIFHQQTGEEICVPAEYGRHEVTINARRASRLTPCLLDICSTRDR